jgi:hypothetical protein
MAFKDTVPFLAFGGKIDPLSEIRNAGIVTSGRVLWVKATGDADYNTVKDAVGADVMFNDVNSAIGRTRNDKNDYVLVTPSDNNAVYTLGSSVDLNKSRMHLIGVGYNRNPLNYAVTLRGFATTAGGTPIDSEYINVTGGGVEVAGIRMLGTVGTSAGGTVTNGMLLVGTGSTGTAHDLWVHDSTFEFTSASLGTPSVVNTPGTVHGARFDNCWFGNVAAGLESAGNSGVVNLGHGGKRWEFRDSKFVYNPGSVATDAFVTAGTGAKEYTIFKNCDFFSLGTGLITSAVRGSITVNNPVYMRDNGYVGVAQAGTDPSVFKTPVASGTSAAIRDYGLSIGTAALQPA